MIQTTIAAPTPLGTDVAAGPLTLRLEEAIVADGTSTVANTNPQSEAPPEGLAYVLARFTVTNTGALPGAEIVQLWVLPPPTGVNRPKRELKGFAKVHLQPGETKEVEITVEKKLATSPARPT